MLPYIAYMDPMGYTIVKCHVIPKSSFFMPKFPHVPPSTPWLFAVDQGYPPVTTVPPATDRPPRPPFRGRQRLPATPRGKPAAAWSGQVISCPLGDGYGWVKSKKSDDLIGL